MGEVWVEKGRYKSGEEVHGERGQTERRGLIPGREKKRDCLIVRVWLSVDSSSNIGLWTQAHGDTRGNALDSPWGLSPKDLAWRVQRDRLAPQ